MELETRRRIYERILAVPGIHLRRLAREVAVPVGTLEHHLHLMERHGLVRSFVESHRRAVVAAEDAAVDELPILHLLRQRTWRRLLLELLREPDLTFPEIVARIGLTPSTVSYHLTRLRLRGVLAKTTVGRTALYQVLQPERLRRLLDRHHDTFRPLGGAAQVSPAFEGLLRRIPPNPPTRPALVSR